MMSVLFNQIYLNEEILPKYPPHTHTHTYIYIYKYIYIYIYIYVCVCVSVYLGGEWIQFFFQKVFARNKMLTASSRTWTPHAEFNYHVSIYTYFSNTSSTGKMCHKVNFSVE